MPRACSGSVLDRIAVIAEDVMVEHVPPRRELVRRQVPHRDDRVIERVERRQQRRLGVAPPEIDQRAEIVERENVVPPQAGM